MLTRYADNRFAKLVTASMTLGDYDDIIKVDTSGGAVTITLPLAEQNIGKVYVISVAGLNDVTLTRSGSDTINGAASDVTISNTEWGELAAVESGDWTTIRDGIGA